MKIIRKTTTYGLVYVESEQYRVVAYAGGGYGRMIRQGPALPWRLLRPGEEIPTEIEIALCDKAGLTPQPREKR